MGDVYLAGGVWVLRPMGACTGSGVGGRIWKCDGKMGSALARGVG